VGALAQIADWPVDHAVAVAITKPTGAHPSIAALEGDVTRVFELASVTKLLVAYATLIAIEDGTLSLDDPVGEAGPTDATVRHLLAHASGLGPDGRELAMPGKRRIYSNAGFELLAELVAESAGVAFVDYLAEAVLVPLELRSTRLEGSPAVGATSTGIDMARFAVELLSPTLIDELTLRDATSVAYPGLPGVLPGFGRQATNDWGLGFELRDDKSPHWTGSANSPTTFGHFGQSGTFLWVDPVVNCALVCLTDRPFDQWAVERWPAFSDAVLREVTRSATTAATR
jgi:CubicO group peptidase (beta-lactamase class C family)